MLESDHDSLGLVQKYLPEIELAGQCIARPATRKKS